MANAEPTLTFTQFHQQTGKGADAFTKYLTYVANFRGNRLAHGSADPLAPIAPSVEIPLLNHTVQGQIAPQLAATGAQYNAASHNAADALAYYSKGLASFYQPQADESKNQAVDASRVLSDAASTGPPLTGAAANVVPQLGDAQAEREANIGAARTAFSSFLPTYAANTGNYTLGNSLAAINKQRATALAGINAQAPGLFSNLFTAYQNNEIQKAVARETAGYHAATTAVAQQRAGATVKKTNASVQTVTNPVTGKKQQIPVGYIINSKGQVVRAPTPVNPAVAAQAQAKAKNSALAKAGATATRLIAAAIKTRPVKVTIPQTITAPGGRVVTLPGKQVTKPERVANYYGTIHQIIQAVTPVLSPYMTAAEITQWVQHQVNGQYGPGRYGQPGTGAAGPYPGRH